MSVGRTVRRWLDGAEVRRLAIAGFSCIVVLGALGAVYAEAKPGEALESKLIRALPIGLNNEGTVQAVFSALLLFGAAGAAWMYAQMQDRRVDTWVVGGLAVLFAFMGLDEILVIHETLESITNVPWLRLYLPLMAVGGVGWLVTIRQLRPAPLAALAWTGGGAAWLVAQALEKYQWEGSSLVHRWTILPEEMLEMTGSLLFGLALVVGLQRRGARPIAPGPSSERSSGATLRSSRS